MTYDDAKGYDDTNRGALFPAENQQLVRSGPINIAGTNQFCAIVQTKTKNGKTVFEVYQKIGAVFPNSKKRNDDDYYMSGKVDLPSGNQLIVWGRKKKSKNGNDYTAISLSEPKVEDRYTKQQGFKEMKKANDHIKSISSQIEDDEIPF